MGPLLSILLPTLLRMLRVQPARFSAASAAGRARIYADLCGYRHGMCSAAATSYAIFWRRLPYHMWHVISISPVAICRAPSMRLRASDPLDNGANSCLHGREGDSLLDLSL
jgi:hypothetical protein